MKLLQNTKVKFGFITALFGIGLVAALVFSSSPARVQAQNSTKGADNTNAAAAVAALAPSAPGPATSAARSDGAARQAEAS